MKECAVCKSALKVVMVPDAVGKGLHEAYECPTHGVVTETVNVRAKCMVKMEMEVEVEYDTEEYDPEYISDSLSITIVPEDGLDFNIQGVTCLKSEPVVEANA